MVKLIALYPGQGSQYPKMALDLYDASTKVKELFTLASEITHQNLFRLLDEGSEEDLKQTETTQLVVTLANRAAQVRLKELGFAFSIHSGFSLGELSAYAGGGILDDETLFAIVQKRGLLMAHAGKTAETTYGKLGMAAVIGMDFESIETVLRENNITFLYPANDNGPSQVVLAGLQKSMDEAKSLLLGQGARRIIPLKVSGPFHTPFMENAKQEFAQFLANRTFSDCKERVLSSVTAKEVCSADEARRLLSDQLACPVRWTKVMKNIKTTVGIVEVGAGTVLTGLWKNSGLEGFCTPLGTEGAIQAIRKED